MSPEELEQAQVMLDDGASYHEVGRSLGRSPGTIQRHFPGCSWTQDQITAHAVVMRKFNRKKYEVKA
ncbi:helix-turn-helix domain-containing protein [Mycobacteroides salmoniphilum]|uniref:helix-turn-helix domain-containing protein n=1 Tax=Mycobacteroides salmoniphilum TaxID=404941 RepID=UPI0035632F80